MAIALQCKCGQQLQVQEEHAGKQVQCPVCQAVMVVSAPEAFTAATVTNEFKHCPDCGNRLPREAVVCVNCGLDFQTGKRLQTKVKKSAKKAEHSGNLAQVQRGLAFHYARLIIFLASPVVLLLGLAVGGVAGGLAGGALASLIGILVALALLSTPVLGIIGSILCASVPGKSARSMILVSMSMDTASFGLGLAIILFSVTGVLSDAPGLGLALQFVQFALSVAAWVLFMTFLRRLARSMEEWGLADEAGSIIWFGALLVLVPPLVMAVFSLFLTLVAGRGGGAALAGTRTIVILVLAFVQLILLIKFAFQQLELIRDLRRVIAQRMAAG